MSDYLNAVEKELETSIAALETFIPFCADMDAEMAGNVFGFPPSTPMPKAIDMIATRKKELTDFQGLLRTLKQTNVMDEYGRYAYASFDPSRFGKAREVDFLAALTQHLRELFKKQFGKDTSGHAFEIHFLNHRTAHNKPEGESMVEWLVAGYGHCFRLFSVFEDRQDALLWKLTHGGAV